MKTILFVCCGWRCRDWEFNNIGRRVHGARNVEINRKQWFINDGQTCLRFITENGETHHLDGLEWQEVKTCGHTHGGRFLDYAKQWAAWFTKQAAK